MSGIEKRTQEIHFHSNIRSDYRTRRTMDPGPVFQAFLPIPFDFQVIFNGNRCLFHLGADISGIGAHLGAIPCLFGHPVQGGSKRSSVLKTVGKGKRSGAGIGNEG